MSEFTINRANHLIDPQVHIWGWEIPVYLFLGGLTAGIMIMSALIAMRQPADKTSRWARWAPFAAPILLSLGMNALLLDLEHKLFVFRFYLAFEITSPISWGAWILILIYPATLLLGLINLSRQELAKIPIGIVEEILVKVREVVSEYREIILWSNVVLGIALGAYTGVFLGSLGARAAWSSPILGPLFLVSGLSTSMALMMLLPVNHEEHGFLRRWDIAAIFTEIALIGVYLIGLISSGTDSGAQAAQMFLGGSFTAAFWSLVVILGLIVPVSIELLESRLKLTPTLAAPALILIGGLSLRWILVLAGQS